METVRAVVIPVVSCFREQALPKILACFQVGQQESILVRRDKNRNPSRFLTAANALAFLAVSIHVAATGSTPDRSEMTRIRPTAWPFQLFLHYA